MSSRKPLIVVIGGGHAGVEAALAAAAKGARSILVTPDPGKIALMSCNPSIGGIAKGTLVREIDALGGSMGLSADLTAVQFRMLNMKKGPAVWGPRVQTDVRQYCAQQKRRLEEASVEIVPGIVKRLCGSNEKIESVLLEDGGEIKGDGFVIAAGTFLGGMLHRGKRSWPGGRRGDISSFALERDLRERMFHVKRFKTGTSPRVLRRTVDVSRLEEQAPTEMDFRFSALSVEGTASTEKCWITRTTEEAEDTVRANLKDSPLYTGRITGKGPRYCPSFEDKVTRFPERTGHPIHLEPMGRRSRVMYLNGLSTSLPEEIQERTVRSLPGFENAVISAYGYSVEYSFLARGEFTSTLRMRGTGNLYAAGQILGTSGYEEAAAAGLLAGANAASAAMGEEEAVPDRMKSYLGVMIDDLVSRGAEEPYRLFSSRAENRLYLRQDNADERMEQLAEATGTRSPGRVRAYAERKRLRGRIRDAMLSTRVDGFSLEELSRRPEITADDIAAYLPASGEEYRNLLATEVLNAKYSGYIKRAERRHSSRERFREVSLRGIEDYSKVSSLSIEAVQALERVMPATVREAEGMPAVREADLEALILHLMKADVSRETP